MFLAPCPQRPWHVGIELWESCRQGRGSLLPDLDFIFQKRRDLGADEDFS